MKIGGLILGRIFSFLFLLSFSISAFDAAAAKRVALVIGNGNYVHVPELANPGNDAADISLRLKQLDFDVVEGKNLDFQGMRRTIRNFVTRLRDADIALFYYAGHGLQVAGENYMAPVDARLSNENDLEFEAIPMAMVLGAMERNSKTNLVFLDACRDNPLAVNLARSMGTRSASVGKGLARIGSGVGTLIAFATQPGNVALDGSGRNSPFTAALVKHLGRPGEDVVRSLIRVRRDVLASTDGKQVPWDNSSLTGEVILGPDLGSADHGIKAGMSEQEISDAAQIAFWNSIKAGNDKAYFEAYLRRYPDGMFQDIARLKIEEVNTRSAPKADSKKQTPDKPVFDKSLLALLDPDAVKPDTEELKRSLTPEDVETALDLDKEDYQRVQVALNALGYDVGTEDGAFGSKSRSGLRKFQIRNRIEESGYLTDKTLQSLITTFEGMPKTFEGRWFLQFHRHNKNPKDPTKVLLRSILATAIVNIRDGEMFIIESTMPSSDKPLFDTFNGRLSENGKLAISMRIDSLFGKQQEVNVRVNGELPKFVPYGRIFSFFGSKLWANSANSEDVWLRLEMRRIKS